MTRRISAFSCGSLEARDVALAELAIVRVALLLQLAQHAADARVRVLHVVDRIVVALRARQVDVEDELRIGLRATQEAAHRVAADLLDQIAQRDVAAGALGELHFLAAAHDRDHLVQHVVRIALRDADVERLQAGAHARERAVVIGAELGDRALVAALPLGDVIGDVRHEVRVRAVGLAHHAVLVVAEVGRAQPQRAAFLVGVAAGDQLAHGLLDLAVGVQRRLEVVDVEAHAERCRSTSCSRRR